MNVLFVVPDTIGSDADYQRVLSLYHELHHAYHDENRRSDRETIMRSLADLAELLGAYRNSWWQDIPDSAAFAA